MLRLPILLSSLLVTPVADTVWWNTNGGNVSERRDSETATCTLRIDNDDGQFQFTWDRNLPTRITASRNDWKFQPDEIATVAMRVGSVWLGNGNGTPNIPAITGPSALMFILDQPIDDLLLSADEIAISTTDDRFGIILIRSKINDLIVALRKCRAAIGR
jgi:hypothetical protein